MPPKALASQHHIRRVISAVITFGVAACGADGPRTVTAPPVNAPSLDREGARDPGLPSVVSVRVARMEPNDVLATIG